MSLFEHIVASMLKWPLLPQILAAVTSDHISATMSHTIVAFNSAVAFVIPFVALVTSLPVMRCKERL